MISDIVDLKMNNMKTIIDLIRFKDTLTKKDIADISGLSITTIANICNELKSHGVISEEEGHNTRIGRIPKRILFHYDKYFVIGIDLQIKDTLKIAVTNLRNELIFLQAYDISSVNSVEEIAILAKRHLDSFIYIPKKKEQYIGVGISVPAVYDAFDSTLISSSIELYNHSPMKMIFAECFNLPVYVDNSSNFKAISALTKYRFDNIVCLDISQGAGVGVVCNGKLLRGKNGYGGEIAHIPLGDSELKCESCGNYGCIETELQMGHLLKNYFNYDSKTPLLNQWSEFAHHVNKNPLHYKQLLNRTSLLMGQLSTILINLFDPSLFILTGCIMDIFEFMKEDYMNEVKKRCAYSISRQLEFKIESYDSTSIFEGISDAMYKTWSPLNTNI